MTDRNAALQIAKQRYAAFQKARTDHDYGRGPEPREADYGYRHGWVMVDGFSFGSDELTGQPYDITQGGWAFI